jgi:hypothetical protein
MAATVSFKQRGKGSSPNVAGAFLCYLTLLIVFRMV